MINLTAGEQLTSACLKPQGYVSLFVCVIICVHLEDAVSQLLSESQLTVDHFKFPRLLLSSVTLWKQPETLIFTFLHSFIFISFFCSLIFFFTWFADVDRFRLYLCLFIISKSNIWFSKLEKLVFSFCHKCFHKTFSFAILFTILGNLDFLYQRGSSFMCTCWHLFDTELTNVFCYFVKYNNW